MTRITGIELKDNWKVDYALTKIKGIGWAMSRKILEAVKVDGSKRVSEISADVVAKIASEIEKYPNEGELARQVRSNINRLQVIGSYRGMRHSRGLPVRGQRTKSNARTKRGKRKTVGAFRKEALAKIQQTQNK
ncbi:30S ribosomal protein S13 [Candidatus Woesebacteria bacterium]|nr:MAG: 30S ribosomal protein S13 [Candidatus Woesebacteria bacterium]